MQDQLTQAGLDVVIVGVNAIGFEVGNATVTQGRDIPWLQDTAEQTVWADWAVTYRDVIILDANNEVVATYNLTPNNLGDPASYETLYQLFVSASAP